MVTVREIVILLAVIPTLAWADIGAFPNRELDQTKLAQELVFVGFTCRIMQTDRVIENNMVVLESQSGEAVTRTVNSSGRKVLLDSTGNIVHPSDARPRETTRYIRLDCDEVIDRAVVQGVLDTHDVTPMWRRKLKTEAETEAVTRLRTASTVLVTNTAQAKLLQTALDDLYDAIDAMALDDLKALDVTNWVGWS